MGLINKIKTCGQSKGGNIEEIVKECNVMCGGKESGKSYHPVFIELGRWIEAGKEKE